MEVYFGGAYQGKLDYVCSKKNMSVVADGADCNIEDLGNAEILNHMHLLIKRYVGLKAFRESGSLIGFRFMFEDLAEIYPLNEEKIFKGDRNLNIVATNVETGKADYFTNKEGREIFYDAIKASASLPIISKMVEINGNKYLVNYG